MLPKSHTSYVMVRPAPGGEIIPDPFNLIFAGSTPIQPGHLQPRMLP